MVGHHEQPIPGDGDATIDSASRVARQAFRARSFETPDLAPVAGIERHALVDGRDVHDAVDNDGRDFEPRAAGQGKHPRRRQRRHVRPVDLIECAVSIAAELPVIRRPVDVRGHLAQTPASRSQQSNAPVIRQYLQIVVAAIQRDALECRSLRCLESDARAIGALLGLQLPDELDERAGRSRRERHPRHAGGRQAIANQGGKVLVVAECQPVDDVGSALAAASVRAVALRAELLEKPLTSLDGCGGGRLSSNREGGRERGECKPLHRRGR